MVGFRIAIARRPSWFRWAEWSPNGRWISTVGQDGAVWVFGVGSSDPILPVEEVGQAFSWSPDGATLAGVMADGTVRLWNPATGKARLTLEGCGHLLWSPDGRFAIGAHDSTLRLWDTNTGELLQALKGYSGGIWSPRGSLVAARSDHEVCLWDTTSGQIRTALPGVMQGWSPDGSALATYDNGFIRVYEPATASLRRALNVGSAKRCSVHLSPRGDKLAIDLSWRGFTNEATCLLDFASGTLHELGGAKKRITDVRCSAWSPDGSTFATACSLENDVRLWDAATGKRRKVLKGHRFSRIGDSKLGMIEDFAWSPDGATIATGSLADKTVLLYDSASGRIRQKLDGHADRVRRVVWSPDGQLLAVVRDDATIALWDVRGGRCVSTCRGHAGDVHQVAWSSNGSTVASSGQHSGLRIWSGASSRLIREWKGRDDHRSPIAWSPDSADLAAGVSSHHLACCSVPSGRVNYTFERWWGSAVVWAPGGHAVAGDDFRDIRIWKLHRLGSRWSNFTSRRLKGHTDSVRSLAWSPDGCTLASGSQDKTVRLWNPETGTPMHLLEGHEATVNMLRWSPDGNLLASGSADHSIRLWADSHVHRVLTGHSSPSNSSHGTTQETIWPHSVKTANSASGTPKEGLVFIGVHP